MKLQEKTKTALSGTWHNQHNSEVHFEIDETGKVTGWFKTGVGGNIKESETFPLTGFATDDMISFCVDFSKYDSMTAWVGQLADANAKRFSAMWHMMANAHEHNDQVWKSIWTGQDSFEAGPRESELAKTYGQVSHPLFSGII